MDVLIVDDNPTVRALLAAKLDLWGFQPVQAEGGEAALSLVRDQKLRMVVTDWDMPGMDGLELCRHLRELPDEFQPVHVVLCTGKDSPEEVSIAQRAGANDYIPKPINFTDLRLHLMAGERRLWLAEAVGCPQGEHGGLNTAFADEARCLFQLLSRPQRLVGGLASSSLFLPSHRHTGCLYRTLRLDDRFSALVLMSPGAAASTDGETRGSSSESSPGGAEVLRRYLSLAHWLAGEDLCFPLLFSLQRYSDVNALRENWWEAIASRLDSASGSAHFSGMLVDAETHSAHLVWHSGAPPLIRDHRLSWTVLPEMGAAPLETVTIPFGSFHVGLLYSPSLTACRNKAGEELGLDRLHQLLQAAPAIEPSAILHAVEGGLRTWRGSVNSEEDTLALTLGWAHSAPR